MHLVHVSQYDAHEALAFPQARRLLVQWGLSEEDDPPSVVADRLGIEVDNIRLALQEPTSAIVDFLSQHATDLVVLATHGRDGMEHWLKGSVAEAVFRRSAVPTLFITPGARGFVGQVNGDIQLRRVLIPVDFSPRPGGALVAIHRFCALMSGAKTAVHLLHVGDEAPPLQHPINEFRTPCRPSSCDPGNVVTRSWTPPSSSTSTSSACRRRDITACSMRFRGSTTERVIRHAPCPVFALSAA